uniref:Replication-associated protein n=1 Tax=Chloris striate mosaic virus TaxID=10820 RepID=J7FHB8_CSMV|nr:RepA [Chloris striate mosaic virus]
MSSLPVSESEGEGSGTSVQVPSRGGQVTPGEKAFSLRTKHVFLTYPRCPISPEEAGQKIAEGLKNKKCNYIYISREFHADGEPHLHAFVQLEANFRTTSPKYFDLDEFHPNIQAARQPTNTLKYCMKHPESSWEFGKFLKPKVNRSPTQSASRDKTMKQIMANATNRDEYLSMIRKSFPFEWAVRLQQFQYSANALFPDPPQSYSAPYASRDMSDHPVIGEWLQQELYTVSPQALSLHAGISEEQARIDLQWMSDLTRSGALESGDEACTSADQLVPVRPPGPEVLELITTGSTQ